MIRVEVDKDEFDKDKAGKSHNHRSRDHGITTIVSSIKIGKFFFKVKTRLDFDLTILVFRFKTLINRLFFFEVFFGIFKKSFVFSIKLFLIFQTSVFISY